MTSPGAARRSEGAASRAASPGAGWIPARSSVVTGGWWSERWHGWPATGGSRCATRGGPTSTKPFSISAVHSYASTTCREVLQGTLRACREIGCEHFCPPTLRKSEAYTSVIDASPRGSALAGDSERIHGYETALGPTAVQI